VYVSRSVKCEYCGNQRSEKARAQGLTEGQYDDLLNFESSAALTEREKAALAYAEAITWRLDADDALWDRTAWKDCCPSRYGASRRSPNAGLALCQGWLKSISIALPDVFCSH
jgi:alkylhydroperoxidase family enzyme